MCFLPIEICRKIRLYNSHALADLFRSRLKANSLMTLFKVQSGRYIRLWHCMEPISGNKWTSDIERKIQYYKYCKGGAG